MQRANERLRLHEGSGLFQSQLANRVQIRSPRGAQSDQIALHDQNPIRTFPRSAAPGSGRADRDCLGRISRPQQRLGGRAVEVRARRLGCVHRSRDERLLAQCQERTRHRDDRRRQPPPPGHDLCPQRQPPPGKHGDVAASTYFAFGSGANPSEIDAPLGRLGRISVSFHPSGRVHVIELKRRPAGQDCAAPQRLVRRLGVFSGTIRFRGENGYTSVTATHARGSVGTPLAPSCGSASQIAAGESAAQEPSAIAEATLSALNKRNGAQFEAATASGGVDYSAFSAEPLGVNLIVSRSAHAIAPRTSFAFDGSLSSAKIKPPAPFSGRAGYDLGQGRYAPTWAGSLSVTFPGASMPLTGPNFKATLAPGY